MLSSTGCGVGVWSSRPSTVRHGPSRFSASFQPGAENQAHEMSNSSALFSFLLQCFTLVESPFASFCTKGNVRFAAPLFIFDHTL